MRSKFRRPFPTQENNIGRRILLLIICCSTLLYSCGQDFNSNSGDSALGDSGIDCSTPAGARLCAAYEALKANHCFQCHTDMAVLKTDAAWLSSGRVTAAAPDSSSVIQRLQNAGSTMPQGFGPLPAADYQALRDWITNL